MATGRIRRKARRGLAVATLGWLSAAVAAVLLAPGAAAAPAVTVHIRDLTPPVASVDAGGTVTFVNEIQDKAVKVGPGGLVTVTARTEVALTLPSGRKALAPGASVTERFNSSCLNCVITYTYRLSGSSSLTSALQNEALSKLGALPAPTPFLVQTIAPDVPQLPSVNVPQVPEINVPLPDPGPAPVPGGPIQPGDNPPDRGPEPGPTPEGIPGDPYQYNTGTPRQVAPIDTVAAAAFDPSRFFVPGESLGGTDRGASGGSGGQPGTYDGASVPVFGELAGLDSAALDEATADEAAAARGADAALPVAALVAVVALAAVTAALVKTHQASRASR